MERARRALVVVGAVVVAASGCDGLGGSGDPAGLTPDEFVSVIVELRRAERELEEADSAAQKFAARRAEILAEHGATEEDVRRFVARRGGDFDLMNELWDSINQRLRYLPAPDTARLPGPPMPPGPGEFRDTVIR